MTDRELLELAAKAAGKEGGYLFRAGGSKGSGFPYHIEGFQLIGGAMWNPLANDGDALRLAVNLRIDISFDRQKPNLNAPFVMRHVNAIGEICQIGSSEQFGTDPDAAARRAIVRAAAEIGKQT